MVLTFKSSTPQERYIVDNSDFGRRTVRAVQDLNNSRLWDVTLKNPSGTKYNKTVTGDVIEATLWMNQMLMDHENEFKQEAARGHKPVPSTNRDLNVRIDDQDRAIGNAGLYRDVMRDNRGRR